MAFFKSRKNANTATEDSDSDTSAPPTIDALRRRARQRLIGATVLVLIAVVGFPLLFDTQPRPVAVDIRVNMPDKDKVKADAAVQPLPDAAAHSPAAVAADKQAAAEPKEEILPPKVPAKAESVASDQSASKPAESAAAPAAAADNKAATPRFVVQVGSYAEESKVKEVRGKLGKLGLKTYTHVAETKEGKRTRVRIGPFDTKEEAQKAIDKIKGLQLQAVILTL